MSGWGRFWWFVGGALVGATCATVVCKGNTDFKPLIKNLVTSGFDAKEAFMAKMETCKEDIQDLIAEAQHENAVRHASDADGAKEQKTATSSIKSEA